MTHGAAEKLPLLIRADASLASGTGHVMRCIALAQAWQDIGGSVVMGMAAGASVFAERLVREGIVAERVACDPGSESDAAQTLALAHRVEARWVVADGYWADTRYQRSIREAGLSLLLVDDTGELAPYEADLILNQNLHASEGMYRERRPGTSLLLGTRFALLRREFRGWRGFAREIPSTARRILVTLGGSDPAGATARVVRALSPMAAESELKIVVGPANARVDEITIEAQRWGSRAEVLQSIEDFPALLAWADLAVSGGGSTCWELTFFGVPFVTIVLAPNQATIAGSLERAGVSRNVGREDALDQEKLVSLVRAVANGAGERQRMSEAGRSLVDGRGAERVVDRLCAREAA